LWENDKLVSGFGRVRSHEVACTEYIGTFTGEQRTGFGRLKLGAHCYTGGWVNGVKHGCAKDTWPNGDTFTGCFEKGKMNCFGTYTWVANKSSYEGEWKDGVMHGYGIRTSTKTDENGLTSQTAVYKLYENGKKKAW
jgi:hypothetical protein